MFKTKKFIVFFIAALIGITLCQAAKTKKPAKAKSAKVKKAAKPAEAKQEKAFGGSVCTNYSGDEQTCKHSKNAIIGFGFCTPLQFPCENTIIKGFRLSAFYTYNYGVNGLDCGLVCGSGAGGTKGMQAAFANKTAGSMTGLSLALINIAGTDINGVQIGGLYNEAGSDAYDNAGANYNTSCGVQLGTANVANSIFKGLQLGAFNIASAVFKGCQIGVINLYEPPSDVFDDFQTKEFNKEKKARSCVQIGALNFNPNGIFPITLLINF